MSDKPTGQASDRRQGGRSLEDDAKGLLARAERDGTPSTKIQLRETGEAKDVIIGLVREEFARSTGRTLIQAAPATGSEASVEGQLSERLQALVVEAINALPEDKRTVRGKVRTGEEIARAIPDQAAFLREVDLMRQGTFFELNEAGQLVITDGCYEAYGLGEDSRTAKKRQTRVVYRGEDGTVQVMEGNEYFTADENGNLALSDAAKAIPPSSILMEKGLPTLQRNGTTHTGEYARMNDQGQFDQLTFTWTEDESLDSSSARSAYWQKSYRGEPPSIHSTIRIPQDRNPDLGSRGVLRVNLNLEP